MTYTSLLRHYRPYAPPTAFLLATMLEKMNMFIFRRSRIEVESQSNRNFDNYVAVESKSNRSRIAIVIAALPG